MPKIMELNFITGNKGKLKEVSAILQDVITLRNQDLDLLEIQGTIEEVTKAKCNQAADLVKGPVLVEDTALIFHALTSGKPGAPELPGPYIKWFLKGMGVENLPKLLDGFEDKSAEAVCTFAFSAGPGSEPALFQGRASVSLGCVRCSRY